MKSAPAAPNSTFLHSQHSAISRLLRFHAGKSSGQIDVRRNKMEQFNDMITPADLILASIRFVDFIA